MRIKSLLLTAFKRFKNLKIAGLQDSVKLVLLVGPNGCGKSSVFEGLNHWYKLRGFNNYGDKDFYLKKGESESTDGWFNSAVKVEFHGPDLDRQQTHHAFYFRTAYRNEADFTIEKIARTGDPSDRIRFDRLISTDAAVSENYKRLVSLTLKEVYGGSRDALSVKELRNELIGKVQTSLSHVFKDLQLESVGDPLVNGSFYFTKGSSKGFHYKNLSAGEKSAFDLILDLVVQREYYPEAVFCIDEPEVHMHTSLQSLLLEELYSMIPAKGQMWITTHSIGMLQKAREIEARSPGTVAFLDFSDIDFDSEVVLEPAKIDITIWRKFMDLSFGELSGLIAPKTLIFCEGDPDSMRNRNFDARVYQTIFGHLECEPCFVSVGSCNEVFEAASASARIIQSIVSSSRVMCLVDRDDRSDTELEDLKAKRVRVLSRRHLECYLLDDEVISKLCKHVGHSERIEEMLAAKRQAVARLMERGKPSDDIKSAAPEIVEALKRGLGLRQAGSSAAAFLRDILAPLVTTETSVYEALQHDIFGDNDSNAVPGVPGMIQAVE